LAIFWTIDHYVTGSGEETTVEGSDDLCVWFHGSDPSTDSPDQVVDSSKHDFEYESTGDEVRPPVEVKSEAVWNEVLDRYGADGGLELGTVTIIVQAACEKIKYINPGDTVLT